MNEWNGMVMLNLPSVADLILNQPNGPVAVDIFLKLSASYRLLARSSTIFHVM